MIKSLSIKLFTKLELYKAAIARINNTKLIPIIRSTRITAALLLAIATLSVVVIGLNSLVVTSMAFHPANSMGPPVKIESPYTSSSFQQKIAVISLFYRGYGNTALRLTRYGCFKDWLRVNGEVVFAPPHNRCDELIIDLKNWLKPGNNTIKLPVDAGGGNIIALAVGSPLFGWNVIQSYCAMLFIGSLLALIWLSLENQGYDFITCLIFSIGYLFYFQSLHTIPHVYYRQDLEWHTNYIQYLSEHFFYPSEYNKFNGVMQHHPPLYYWLCALIAQASEFFGVFDAWTGIRLLSVFCYITFIYFGMRTMSLFLNGSTFYIALSLLLFWPAGMIYATRVNNDVLFYPLYAASFYYTLGWYKNSNPRWLSKALVSCGLAFTAKTSALVPASVLGSSILFQLATRRCTVRAIINKESLVGSAVFIAGILLNIIRSIRHFQFNDKQQFSLIQFIHPWQGGYKFDLEKMMSFDVVRDINNLFSNPFFSEDPVIWHCHIKALIFNNMQWYPHPASAPYLNMLYLLMLIYMAVFIATLSKEKFIALFPLLTGLLLPFIASYLFLLIGGLHADSDIHYIWPVIIPIIIVFMLSVRETKDTECAFLYYTGNIAALIFAALSINFFIINIW